jgi:hypothetical protein
LKIQGRDDVAKEIEFNIFSRKTLWSLIFSNTKDGLRFAAGSFLPDGFELYSKMLRYVSDRLRAYNATLKDVFVVVEDKPIKLSYQNSSEYMIKAMTKNLPIIFKVQVKNKGYDFQVK